MLGLAGVVGLMTVLGGAASPGCLRVRLSPCELHDLDQVGGEDAIVRASLLSGTHQGHPRRPDSEHLVSGDASLELWDHDTGGEHGWT